MNQIDCDFSPLKRKVIEGLQGLSNELNKGLATLTHSLLQSIFYPGDPLHDGAVLIRANQILSAANVLPLSKKVSNMKSLKRGYLDRIHLNIRRAVPFFMR